MTITPTMTPLEQWTNMKKWKELDRTLNQTTWRLPKNQDVSYSDSTEIDSHLYRDDRTYINDRYNFLTDSINKLIKEIEDIKIRLDDIEFSRFIGADVKKEITNDCTND